MGTSKIFFDDIGIDLTADTVNSNNMLLDIKAHDANGNDIVGNIITYNGDHNIIPKKGQIIILNLTGVDQEYLVLKINGNIAEVVARESVNNMKFNTTESNNYANSDLDIYLNLTYYNTLSTNAKTAITDKDLIQYQYSYQASVYDVNSHSSYADYTTKTQKTVVGKRHIYALGIEDIEEYFNNDFGFSDIQEMFNTSEEVIWLNSANSEMSNTVWAAKNTDGYLARYYVNNDANVDVAVRPAFQIDLSKISWSATYDNRIVDYITVSSEAPTPADGSNGDVWIVVAEDNN